jgi:hypothetical protein
VCNAKDDCNDSNFDEIVCGCEHIDQPIEIIIALDMSVETWRRDNASPKHYKDFAKKLIERFSITNKKERQGDR